MKYLEVLASIHFINESTFLGNGDESRLKERLLEAKPSLGDVPNIDDIISKAYTNLLKLDSIYGSR